MNNVEFGASISPTLLREYFKHLVNQFFKILPMRENNEVSLSTYMGSLQVELIGSKDLIPDLCNDPNYLVLLSILQYLIKHPECSIKELRREVFHAISICNYLQSKFLSKKEEL